MNRCRGFGDKYGDHAISCAINGERIAKHNHVRDAIFAAASQAALGPRKEPAGLLPGSDDRPADVLLPFWANGKDAALDISVVNPLQQELVRKVARDGESGVQHSFNIRMGKYSDRCAGSSGIKNFQSWDFAKSRTGNPGIENSWSRWCLHTGRCTFPS